MGEVDDWSVRLCLFCFIHVDVDVAVGVGVGVSIVFLPDQTTATFVISLRAGYPPVEYLPPVTTPTPPQLKRQ